MEVTDKNTATYMSKKTAIGCFLIVWLLIVLFVFDEPRVFTDYFQFAFLGVTGALFANSTGAGGGVVFIPMFKQLNFHDMQSIATSFAIQCFGMTAGALTWLSHFKTNGRKESHWQSFPKIVGLSSIMSIAGLWTAYGFDISPPGSLHQLFSVFSIIVGLMILGYVFLYNKPVVQRDSLERFDVVAIVVVSYVGGIITAWLSVGVGEALAIYLISRKFNTTLAVACAVVVTAFTVWSAALEHLLLNSHANWNVLLFAGPGAVVGGVLAKNIVDYLSAKRLKILFAMWILIMGIWG